MSKILLYINIIAALLLLFAGSDQFFSLAILNPTGLIFVIFTAATFILITTFLQLTVHQEQ